MATAISGTVAAAIMLYLLARQHRLSASFLPVCGKIMLASALMGAAIVSLQFGLDRLVFVPAVFGLVAIVGGGGAVYAVIAYIVGAIPPGLLRTRQGRNT